MSGWSGFTDEELQKLKTSKNVNKETPIKKLQSSSKNPATIIKDSNNRNKNKRIENQSDKNLAVPISNNAPKRDIPTWENPKTHIDKTNDTTEESVTANEKETSINRQEVVSEINENNIENKNVVNKENDIQVPDVSSSHEDVKPQEILSDKKCQEIERSNLEELHLQQKLIEQQNKKKQQLIKETLQQRFKETQNEAMKLKEVQAQLKRLDKLLQKDVDILREKIETATLSFSQAEHRYQVAEKEYVEAKIDYFKKKECKEELTEHLYAIIQENESRKSKKLEELLLKLHQISENSNSEPTSPVKS